MLDTVVFTDSAAVEFFTDEMLLVKIDAEDDSLTAQRYNVMGYPTSVMVDKEGQEVDRLVGFAETEEYIGTFRNYAQGIGTLDDMLARFEVNPDRDSAYVIADKYKYRGAIDEADAWYVRVIEVGEPGDSLSMQARMARADAYLRGDRYDEAREMFENMMEEFAGTETAEEAEIYRAITFRRQGDTAQAIAAFEQFVVNWPESEAGDYAEEQISKLKGEEPEESE